MAYGDHCHSNYQRKIQLMRSQSYTIMAKAIFCLTTGLYRVIATHFHQMLRVYNQENSVSRGKMESSSANWALFQDTQSICRGTTACFQCRGKQWLLPSMWHQVDICSRYITVSTSGSAPLPAQMSLWEAKVLNSCWCSASVQGQTRLSLRWEKIPGSLLAHTSFWKPCPFIFVFLFLFHVWNKQTNKQNKTL